MPQGITKICLALLRGGGGGSFQLD
jgi:hypothetical protein